MCRIHDPRCNARHLATLRLRARSRWVTSLIIVMLLSSGCRLLTRRFAGRAQDGSATPMANPSVIPVADMEFTWHQIVDMVDDYFEIAREQPVREIRGVLMEGQIDTKPLSGAICLDLLRRDATPGYERWHGTLQSIRRTAFLRVRPAAAGYQVYVEVQKELEDTSQPEYSTIGRSVLRHDGSLVAFEGFDNDLGPTTLGWIPIGRDESLEQEMLRQLHARLYEAVPVPDQQP